jgi:hypothetical protein
MKTSELRQFGLVLAVVIAVLWWLFSPEWSTTWLFASMSVITVSALLVPRTMAPFHWLLSKLGHAISRVVTPLLLALLYFLIITPLGIMLRLWGHDPLRRSLDHDAESYRQPSPRIKDHDFDRPF